MTNAEAVLEVLSKAENFQSWEFGRIEEALTSRRSMEKHSPLTYRDPTPDADDPRWAGEPDKVQWIDPNTGLDCLIVRNHMGSLCGYVGAPPGHPFHGVSYGSCTQDPRCEKSEESWCEHAPDQALSVHGGITFSDFCSPVESPETICHVPAPGRPDHVFWFGFDCGHSWDYQPGMVSFGEDTYRDLAYVVEQVENLALQVKAAA